MGVPYTKKLTLSHIATLRENVCRSSIFFFSSTIFMVDRDSAVGIATALRVTRTEDRIPVGARCSAPLQTCPEAYTASYTMDTGYFLGIKRPRCGYDHPPLSSTKVKEKVELYCYSPSGPSLYHFYKETFSEI